MSSWEQRVLASAKGEIWAGEGVIAEVERSDNEFIAWLTVYNIGGTKIADRFRVDSGKIRSMQFRKVSENLVILAVIGYGQEFEDVCFGFVPGGKIISWNFYEVKGKDIFAYVQRVDKEYTAKVFVDWIEAKVENNGKPKSDKDGALKFECGKTAGSILADTLGSIDEFELEYYAEIDGEILQGSGSPIFIGSKGKKEWKKRGFERMRQIKKGDSTEW